MGLVAWLAAGVFAAVENMFINSRDLLGARLEAEPQKLATRPEPASEDLQ